MEDEVTVMLKEIDKLKEDREWLANELVRIEDYYKELLEQKEMECQQLRDELQDLRWREY